MRPFSPHLRLKRDRRRPERLVVQSDVPLRAHALALSVGAAFVVMGHGVGQLLTPVAGPLVQLVAPLVALVLAVAAWLALPSMVLTTWVGRDLVELRRARRRAPLARFLPEEILAVRLAAPARHPSAVAPWRLADRQVELVTTAGNETVAIAAADEARALAKGLSAAMSAPLRDDTPEADAAFCLQQALLAMGRFDAAPGPPEGFRIRAALERGWLVLEVPAGTPSRFARVGLVGVGATLLVAPVLLEAWPDLGRSVPLAVALTLGALCWLAGVVLALVRSHRPTALAASPLGVKITRGRLLGLPTTVTLPPPVAVRSGGGRLELRSGARIVVPAGVSDLDASWVADAITSLAGRPLVPVDDPAGGAPARSLRGER